MRILHLVFHPDLSTSTVNRIWTRQIIDSGKITTSKDMYKLYPDFQFDIGKEQQDLLAHDRIILQFPFYWFMCTPLLKKWLDDVLTYGFAYGTGGKLRSKDLQLILSAGGGAKDYDDSVSVPVLLQTFQLTAEYLSMNYLPPLWMYDTGKASEAEIQKFGEAWVEKIDDPNWTNASRFYPTEVAK